MEALVVLTVLIFCALTGTGSALRPINLDSVAPSVPENIAMLESDSSGTSELQFVGRAT
jgi:hypothetical protein